MSPKNRGAVRHLQDLLDLDADLLRYAAEWAEGYGATSPGNGEPGRGKGQAANPTLVRVMLLELGRVEGAGLADRCLALHEDLHALLRQLRGLHLEARRLAPLTAEAANDAARRAEPRHYGAGYCDVCHRWVPGVDDDRLRGGLCRKHHDQWRYALRTNPADAAPLDFTEWKRVTQMANNTTAGS